MKHQWRACRTFQPHPDAQRRWDRAYQLLLEWTLPPEQATDQLLPHNPTEVAHAHSHVCPCLHPTPGPDTDH